MKPFSTIRYAALKENDIVNGEDVCVSLWTQGCPFHCPGCHNPETWDFNGGIEEDFHILLDKIIKAINKNEVIRNFSKRFSYSFLVFSSDKISFFSILVITNPLSLITMLSLIKYDFFGQSYFYKTYSSINYLLLKQLSIPQ